MTKMQSGTIAFAMLLLGLLLYQNCGPQKAVDFTGNETLNDGLNDDDPNDGDFSDKNSTSESYNYSIMQGNDLTLTANASTYSVFSSGACLWSFTDVNASTQTLHNPSNSLILKMVQTSQSGVYRLVCENTERVHTFKFQVNVLLSGSTTGGGTTGGGTTSTPTPEPERRTGTLYYDGKVAKQSGYTNPKPNLTRTEADAACAEGWAIVRKKGGSKSKTKCMWGNEKIGPI